MIMNVRLGHKLEDNETIKNYSDWIDYIKKEAKKIAIDSADLLGGYKSEEDLKQELNRVYLYKSKEDKELNELMKQNNKHG